MLLGVWVIVFMFLGFPQNWQKILAVITGVYMIILAYSLGSDAPKTTDIRAPFVDHKADQIEKDVQEQKAAPMTTTSQPPTLADVLSTAPTVQSTSSPTDTKPKSETNQ